MNVRMLVLAVSMMALAGCGGDGDSSAEPDDALEPVIADPSPDPTPDPEPQSEGPAGWILQESGTKAPINALSAVDGKHAWTGTQVVHSPQVIEAELHRTQDGGTTWEFLGNMPENQKQVVVYSPTVLQLQFFDANNGFAFSRFSLLSTSDGGQTWTTRQNSLEAGWGAMCFISSSTGWMTSEKYGGVSRTTDGGATWTGVALSGAGRAVKFADSQSGWIVMRTNNSGETVFRSTDAGATWQPSLFIAGDYDNLWIRDIAVIGTSRAWVVGSGGLGGDIIWATADGGATWSQQTSDGSGDLRGVHFVDASNGWAVGRKIHRTTNGGATWTVQPTDQEGFRDVVFVSPTTGWVVGENGVILKTTTKGVK